MIILFSEEMFDIGEIYNFQNDRIWAIILSAADTKGGLGQKRKLPQRVMIWLGVCSKCVFPLAIFEDGAMDRDRYIKEVRPVALKFRNDMFETDWTFQQDSANAHILAKSEEWCAKYFP